MNFIKLAIASVALACAAVPAYAQNTLQDILSGGVLKVGTTGDWNPMTMKDPATNTYTGYDIDVMTELAKDLDVKVEFVPTDWKTLVNGVVSGKYHMTGSASISPARAKVAGYSDSYFSLATVPLTLSKNASKFTDWADLDMANSFSCLAKSPIASMLPNTSPASQESTGLRLLTSIWKRRARCKAACGRPSNGAAFAPPTTWPMAACL